jgi:hypothetical protein
MLLHACFPSNKYLFLIQHQLGGCPPPVAPMAPVVSMADPTTTVRSLEPMRGLLRGLLHKVEGIEIAQSHCKNDAPPRIVHGFVHIVGSWPECCSACAVYSFER